MRLLIITQKVDKNDPILGFFVRWVQEFAKQFEQVTVICLEIGEYRLPPNVKVFSLGKEQSVKHSVFDRFRYVLRFYKYIWQERKNYDAVFVHMNQEYVLLAGDIWRLMGKKVYLWRNHAQGSILTRMAVMMSHKVFCTSPHSYTARFKKTILMPVGIDTDFFKPDPSVRKIPNSILFLGRIALVKKVLEFIEWAETEDFRKVTIAGPIDDEEYGERVKLKIENSKLKINYVGPVTQDEALELYQSHETYVNFTPSGSMDKTILEAVACETSVIVKNEDLKILESKSGKELRDFVVENHSLKMLMDKLKSAFNE